MAKEPLELRIDNRGDGRGDNVQVFRGGGPGARIGGPNDPEMAARIKEAEAARRVVEYRVYYGEYKTYDGVKLPTHLTRAIDGKPRDEIVFDRLRINPRIDPKTFAIESRIPTQGKNPEHCEFAPDAKLLLTSNEGSDNLDVIDLAQKKSVGTIATSGHPRGAAFVPGTTHVYVAQESANVVDVIDLATRKKTQSIPTALRTAGVIVSHDGKRIYAANGGAGSVSVIDVATNKSIAEIPVGQRPWNMALTPDGKKLYVANGRSNSVSVIDTGTLKVAKDIPVGELPWGVVIPQ